MVDLTDEFVLFDFLEKLEKFVSSRVEIFNSGIEAVLIHEVIDVF